MGGVRPVRLLVSVTLCLLAAQTCCAQVFYSVVSPEGRQNWLLGTIHSEDERVLDFPPVLKQALEHADTVALELLPDRAMLDRLASAMQLPEGQQLADRLDVALYRRVHAALADYGMDSGGVARLRPWAAALTLAQPPARTGRFMDLVLARRAAEDGALVVGLETLDEQLLFFTGLDEQAHIALLKQAVEDHEHGAEAFEALVCAYLEADLEKMQQQAIQQLSELPEAVQQYFRVQGITQRNINIARRAQTMLDQGDTLIAVGALHLPGEQGLVALLREQGYRVEEIY